MKNSQVTAEIICVGTELLLGHLINTNASYLARKLAANGINLFYQSVVGDNPVRLSEALRTALRRSDIVITTGGLGPTVDDVTIKTIAKSLSLPLVINKIALKSIKTHFKKRNIGMPAGNERQAYVPKGAIVVVNPAGTAPASIIEHDSKTIVALPGPPRELIPIFENSILPYLSKRHKTHSTIFTRTIKITGSPESAVNKKVSRFLAMNGNVTMGIYASLGEVALKITAKAKNKNAALVKIKNIERKVITALGKIVYGFDDDTLESVVGGLLTKKRCTIGIAESCTGGLISSRITNVSGSSDYFKIGIIAYSNKSKTTELGVLPELIKKYGAVSRPVALAMANGMLHKTGTDMTLSVTGVAGPAGGTKTKPIGLVYIALASHKKAICRKHRFRGTRTDIKLQVSSAALDVLRKALI